MARPTHEQLMARKLEQRGYRLNLQRSTSKFDCYMLTPCTSEPYWLGKAGAVRRGRTVTDSVSITDSVDWKALYSEHYDRNLATEEVS